LCLLRRITCQLCEDGRDLLWDGINGISAHTGSTPNEIKLSHGSGERK